MLLLAFVFSRCSEKLSCLYFNFGRSCFTPSGDMSKKCAGLGNCQSLQHHQLGRKWCYLFVVCSSSLPELWTKVCEGGGRRIEQILYGNFSFQYSQVSIFFYQLSSLIILYVFSVVKWYFKFELLLSFFATWKCKITRIWIFSEHVRLFLKIYNFLLKTAQT